MRCKRIAAAALAGLLALSVLAGCSSAPKGDEVVMQVGDKTATAGEYTYWYNSYASYYAQMFGGSDYSSIKDQEIGEGTTFDSMVRKLVENQISTRKAYEILFDQYGLVYDEEMEQKADEMLANIKGENSDKDFKKNLRNSYGIEVEDFKNMLATDVRCQAVEDYLFGENGTDKVDEQELRDYIEANYVTVRQILVMNTEDDRKTKLTGDALAAAEQKINEALAKLDAGEDFDAVCEEYNEDSGQTEDGYTYDVNNNSYDSGFAAKGAELKVGEYGKADMAYAWSILKRLPTDIDSALPGLLESKQQEIASAKVQEVLDNTEITTDDELIAKIKVG